MSLHGQRTTTGALDWDQFKSIIAKMERDAEFKYCLLMTIGVFTGLRISDLLQLRFIQFENGDILTIQEKKTKKIRRIKINQDLKDIVKRIKGKIGGRQSFRIFSGLQGMFQHPACNAPFIVCKFKTRILVIRISRSVFIF